MLDNDNLYDITAAAVWARLDAALEVRYARAVRVVVVLVRRVALVRRRGLLVVAVRPGHQVRRLPR